jgi:hypothetical protein
MNKVMLMLVMIFFFVAGNVSAADIIETGKEVEIKDNATKNFVYLSLRQRLIHDIWNMYREKYNAKGLEMEHPETKDIKIWIKEAITAPGTQRFTHVIRLYLPYPKVVVDEKKSMKTADICIYAVNAQDLSAYADRSLAQKSVKLIKCYHKVRE